MPFQFGTWLLQKDISANESPLIKSNTIDQEFEAWFVTNGGYLHPLVELASDPATTGKFLRVKPDHTIPSGSTLVLCPHHLSLSWSSANKSHFPQVQLPPCSQHVATRFFLMKQRLLGVASPWWPYIRMLPLSFNTPLYYDSADMAWIRGTNLGRARKVREDAWRGEYNAAVKILFPAGSEQEQGGLWTWELYVWAATVMTSRSFPGPTVFNNAENDFPTHDNTEGKEPVLIPGLDLLNHNPSSHVEWIWNSVACTIKTDELLCGGSEIPNNYGPKSNEELIMGYGFSLAENPADHFSIGFSTGIAANVKITRERRLGQGQGLQTRVIESLNKGKNEETNVHWVRIHNNETQFSPDFLEDISIAVENPREQYKADKSPLSNVTLFNTEFSRNKFHVLCAIMMIIQKGQTAISRYNPDLPERPQNARQVDASRYRHSQLHILNHVLGTLNENLSSLLSKETTYRKDSGNDFRVVRLEDVLTESPKRLQKDLRSVLNAGLKTRDPTKIRERRGTDFVFTVWLCGLLIYYRQYIDKHGQSKISRSAFDEQCLRWLRFLDAEYPEAKGRRSRPEEYSMAVFEADKAAWFDPVRNSLPKEDRTADTATTVASYLYAIRSCVEKHPQSLYSDPELTVERVAWCYKVTKSEGVWVPNLRDSKADDEWMLCLES